MEAEYFRKRDCTANYENQTLGLESQLGYPVKKCQGPRSACAKGRARNCKSGCARLRALQRSDAQKKIGEIAQQDEADGDWKAEAKAHEQGPVNEVLDIGAHPAPQSGDGARGSPSLGFGNQVDALPFNVKGE